MINKTLHGIPLRVRVRVKVNSGAPEGELPFLFLLEKFEDRKEIIRSHIGKLISFFLSSCLLLNLPSLSISRCRLRYEFITLHS
jgi:hypothetical protein